MPEDTFSDGAIHMLEMMIVDFKLSDLRFYGPVNTVELLSSLSVRMSERGRMTV